MHQWYRYNFCKSHLLCKGQWVFFVRPYVRNLQILFDLFQDQPRRQNIVSIVLLYKEFGTLLHKLCIRFPQLSWLPDKKILLKMGQVFLVLTH